MLYELTHWTGAETRLDRTFGERFGDDAYAMEELVAELGAAFLCADLAITPEPRADHAAYIDHWLRVMKGDKKAIFTAASAAAKASDYLAGLGGRDRQPCDGGRLGRPSAKGASVDLAVKNGLTLLVIASGGGHLSVVGRLLATADG